MNRKLQIADIIAELGIGHTVEIDGHYISRIDTDIEMYDVDGERLTFYEAWEKVTR